MLPLTVLQEYRAQFFHLGLIQKCSTRKSSTMKNRRFCVLRHNPHKPQILKNAINIDTSRYSN